MRELYWVLGPSSKFSTGVGIYSMALIPCLRDRGLIVHCVSTSAQSRSVRRYIWQFAYLPIYLLIKSFHRTVILYEEAYSYLIPFARLGGGRVFIIVHHLPEVMIQERGTVSFVERVKEAGLCWMANLLRFANDVITPSEFTKNVILERELASEDCVHVVPNAFEWTNRSKNDAPVSRLGVRKSELKRPIILLNIGSEETRKNVITLIQAISEMPRGQFKLIRIGRPVIAENRELILDLIRRDQVDVEFFQDLTDEELRKRMKEADVYVAPSLYEGFGRTVIEAQIAGLPVVASAIPVWKEVLGDSALLVEQPSSIESWRQVLFSILNNEIDFSNLVKRGEQNWRRFSVEKCGENLIDIIRVNINRKKN